MWKRECSLKRWEARAKGLSGNFQSRSGCSVREGSVPESQTGANSEAGWTAGPGVTLGQPGSAHSQVHGSWPGKRKIPKAQFQSCGCLPLTPPDRPPPVPAAAHLSPCPLNSRDSQLDPDSLTGFFLRRMDSRFSGSGLCLILLSVLLQDTWLEVQKHSRD